MSFSQKILQKTTSEIRTFLDELANGTTNYRTVHSLTRQIEHQYHERFVIELIQNAHDVLNRGLTTTGRIDICLDPDSGPHGALYVANDGRQFRDEDFESVARLGQSTKDPNESAGNKGIGFRSVLEVCDAPEIYSCASDRRGTFDGYGFRFDPTVLSSLRGPVVALLEGQDEPLWEFGGNRCTLQGLRVSELRSRYGRDAGSIFKELELLSPYLLPVPAYPDEHARVSRYAEAGFATVVRLPFKDAEARDKAAVRLHAIRPDVVLFLDALDALTIHDGSRQRTFLRREKERAGDKAKRTRNRLSTKIVISDGKGAERRFWSWRRPVGGDNAAEAECIRKAASNLPGKWPELSKAVVSIAVEVGDSPAEGQFFVFLPTTIPSGSGAHMNAPFYPTMDRKTIDFSEPLNKLLLSELDALTTEVILKDLQGKGTDEARAIVDLAAPHGGAGPLETVIPERLLERGLLRQSIILTDRGWKPAAKSRLLPVFDGASILTSSELRNAATFPAVVEELGSRRSQVQALLESMGGQPRPLDAELASTIAAIASTLARDSGSPWDKFWLDVQALLPDVSGLAGHAVFLDAEGELREADGQVPVFFPSADEGDDGSTVTTSVPPELRTRIAFLSPRIPLRTKRARGGHERTPTRNYLAQIVEKFDVDSIFTKVLLPTLPTQAAPLDSDEGRLCAAILGWAAQLVTSARNSGSFAHHLAKLRLPCRGGWYVAGETAFGPGWGDTLGEDLDAYLEAADTAEAREERCRLLLPREAPAWQGSATLLRDRLESMGVVDGLRPRPCPEVAGQFDGEVWLGGNQPLELSENPPPGVSSDHWAEYREHLEQTVSPNFSGRYEYRFEALRWIPGLDDLERIPPRARVALMRVLVGSMPQWKPEWKDVSLVKKRGQSDSMNATSLLRFSLERLHWLWIEPDVDAVDGSFAGAHGAAPKDHWYIDAILDRGRGRQFEHLQPLSPTIVRLIDGRKAVPALEELGMPVYDIDSDKQRPDTRLLTALAEALYMDLVESGIRDVFLGQVRDAWRRFQPEPEVHLPMKVVVSQGGRQIFAIRPSVANPVYLPEPGIRYSSGGHFARLPVLVIDPNDARRLKPAFQRCWDQGVRTLSSLRLEPWVDGRPWQSLGTVPRLEESELQWLLSFSLAIFAFAGERAYGAQRKKFQSAIADMRAVRVAFVENLSVHMVGARMAEAPEQPELAFWDTDSNTALIDRTRPGWMEALAEPLQRILDRSDLVTILRLALIKLMDRREPGRADILNALETIHISEDQLGEVEQRCLGDLSWVVERIEPALLLLAPEWERSWLRTAGSLEKLATLLGESIGTELADWLVKQAQTSRDDRAMGRALFDRLGQKAELDAWNRALGLLEPPRRSIVNSRCKGEFRDHLERTRATLYSIARYLCKNIQDTTFPELRSMIDSLEAPTELAFTHWEVPFAEVMKALSPILAARGAPADVIAALEGSDTIDDLIGYLEILDPSTDLHRNPIEIHALNHEACKNLLDGMRRAGIIWCRGNDRAFGVWKRSSSELLALVEDELSAREGYIDIMGEERLLALVARTVPHDVAHDEFWAAARESKSMSDFLQRLGVEQIQLSEADRLLAEVREQQRKKSRIMSVYGQDFDSEEANWGQLRELVEAKIPDDALPRIELDRTAALSLVDDRRRSKASSGRTSTGNKQPRLSEEKRRMIGLVGEYFVYRMLRRSFGEKVITPSCWFSEDSIHVFPGNAGHVDDNCGSDFRFQRQKTKYYLEVKSSVGEDDSFEMGASEIQRAVEVADKANEIYCIVHVQCVLSRPRMRVLPNPYASSARGRYVFENRGLRVRYQAADASLEFA